MPKDKIVINKDGIEATGLLGGLSKFDATELSIIAGSVILVVLIIVCCRCLRSSSQTIDGMVMQGGGSIEQSATSDGTQVVRDSTMKRGDNIRQRR